MWLIWLLLGVLLGATFSEAVRATVRKVTRGRFFGPVPAKDSDTPADPTK